jgi:Mrp family chromosome partitioning ATPase
VFDVIVLDSPPVMAVADASILAHAATNVVFVVGSGTPRRELAQIALDRIASVQARIVGVVLNKTHHDPNTFAYDGYGSYQDADHPTSLVRPPT